MAGEEGKRSAKKNKRKASEALIQSSVEPDAKAVKSIEVLQEQMDSFIQGEAAKRAEREGRMRFTAADVYLVVEEGFKVEVNKNLFDVDLTTRDQRREVCKFVKPGGGAQGGGGPNYPGGGQGLLFPGGPGGGGQGYFGGGGPNYPGGGVGPNYPGGGVGPNYPGGSGQGYFGGGFQPGLMYPAGLPFYYPAGAIQAGPLYLPGAIPAAPYYPGASHSGGQAGGVGPSIIRPSNPAPGATSESEGTKLMKFVGADVAGDESE